MTNFTDATPDLHCGVQRGAQSPAKTLSFVVPAYNMEQYLERCVASLLDTPDTSDIEVLIVDDGSSDATPALADRLQATHPGTVRAIHQPNKGHGGAVNTGIREAAGMYVKVVDADDWVGSDSLGRVMETLRAQRDKREPIDLLVTDYVYDKVGKRNKHVVHFSNVMDANKRLGWDDLRHFGIAQYMIMHALTFRTSVVRESGMILP